MVSLEFPFTLSLIVMYRVLFANQCIVNSGVRSGWFCSGHAYAIDAARIFIVKRFLRIPPSIKSDVLY